MTGRTVLHYQLLEKLGAGGMGEIYKAQDTRLNRFVALKVLPAGMSSDPERRRRFLQEAQAASALNHPNIITIYDIVADGDTQYMVVEYVDGKTLLELIPKDGLPVPQTIQYATQMADALGAAHAAGIIHRDFKPANVMITNSGLVKLLDFGLAKLVDRTPVDDTAHTATHLEAPLTVEGSILGTVNYMSPEQAEGKKLDARSDIFSFGAVLYEMLTGRRAFRGDSTVSTLSAVLRDDVQPIAELAPEVPSELEQIVQLCLKKAPDRRFQSMPLVQAALITLKRQSDSGALYNRPIVSAVLPPPPPARRNPLNPIVIGALGLLAAAAAGTFWWTTQHRPLAPPIQAQPPAAPGAKPAPMPEAVLTNDNIVEMVDAQVDPTVIVGQIRSSKTDFHLSSGEVIRLTKAGVPPQVIEAMRNPQAEPASGKIPPANSAAVPDAPAPPAVSQTSASITLGDGVPIHLTLAEDVPSGAAEGDPVLFKAADDVRVNDRVVIPKGAAATGFIVDGAKKKILGIGPKITFRLDKVDAVGGQKVSIRATLAPRRDGPSKRSLEGGGKKSKDAAAAAGTVFVGYVDGANTVLARP